MFGYGIAEIDIAEDVVAVVEHLLKLVAGDRLGINFFAFMVCLLVLARSAHGYDADALAAFGGNRRPMPAVDHPEHVWRTSSFPGFGAVGVTGGIEPVDKIAAFRVLRSGF